jgi:hypothetical protein
MNRPYPTYSTTPRRTDTHRRYADTEVIDDEHRYGYDEHYDDAEDYDDYTDEVYSYVEPMDRRWIWVAAVAGAVLLVAVICTVVILGGGDSGSVSATVAPPATTSAPAATSPAPPAPRTPAAAPSTPLLPETVTTVPPTPSAVVTPTATPPPAAAPVAPGTVTYQVTGQRQLIDLVTVIYTDHQGALQTDVNVALPWTKQVVLDPGVTLKSVTATSITGQLNCAIFDGAGTPIAAQNNNTMITNCTQ